LPEQRSSLVSQRTLERKPEGMRPYIFAVGGGSLFAIHNECEVYNPKTNNWSQIAPMISRRSRAGVASLRKMLWVVGKKTKKERKEAFEINFIHTNRRLRW
jgi:kelch-like protein 17 (actinfilin)